MKTIDEAAKEVYTNATHDEIVAFKRGVEFAQRWIPVEEELPNDTKKVLCKCTLNGKLQHEVGKKLKIGWFFTPPYASNLIVTHWRPIELK